MLSPYQAALDALDDEVCLLDRSGQILFTNTAWQESTREGCSISPMLCVGTNYLDAYRDDSPPEWIAELTKVLQGRQRCLHHSFSCHKTTPPRTFQATFRYLPETEQILVLHKDVTRTQKMRSELEYLVRQAKCLLWSGTVEELPEGGLWWKTHFQDEAAVQRFLPVAVDPEKGYIWSLYLARLDEDRLRADSYGNARVREGQSYSQEFRCRLADGRILWLKDDVTVEVLGPGRWSVVGVMTDITEQKQSSTDLQYLMSGARCLLWHASITATGNPDDPLEWDMTLVNEEAAARCFPVEQAPGETYLQAWSAARLWEESHLSVYEDILAGRSYSQEFSLRGRDQQLYWLQEDVEIESVGPGKWLAIGVCTDMTERKTQMEELQQKSQQLQLALEAGQFAPWIFDTDTGRFNQATTHFQAIHSSNEIAHPTVDDFFGFIHPDDCASLRDQFERACVTDEPITMEYRLRNATGGYSWRTSHVKRDRQRHQLIGVAHDTTQMKLQYDRLRESEEHLRLALDAAKLGAWHLDLATGVFERVSPFLREINGIPEDADFTLEAFIHNIHPDDQAVVLQAIAEGIRTQEHQKAEYRLYHADGVLHWQESHGQIRLDNQGNPTQIIGVTFDITERKERELERAQALREAQERADRDPLTGLLNHRAFHARLERECLQAQRDGSTLLVGMLDLDNFKFFNDAYGHAVGDEVLRKAADYLRACCRPQDILARFGGDEFAFILPDVGGTPLAQLEARLRTHLVFPFQPEGYSSPLPITISLGLALNPEGLLAPQTVLHEADRRLYWDKTGGESEVQADQAHTQLRETRA